MPALKLTTVLYHEHKLNPDIIDELKGYGESKGISLALLKLITAENAKQQIEKLKEAIKEINKIVLGSESTDTGVLLFVKYLVHIFFISITKNPSRRVIVSAFQGFPETIQSTVIAPVIEESLKQLFRQPAKGNHTNEPASLEEGLNLRHNVETVTALIENFHLGECCVTNLCLETLSYLSSLQQVFYDTYRPELSPVQQNEVMHHCLETVKLANRVCQRSAVTMETVLKESVAREQFTRMATIFMKIDIKILQTEEFLLDCKTTSAMNICLLLKFSSVGDHMLDFLSKTVFQLADYCYQPCDFKPLPDWLTKLDLDQLHVTRLSNSSYLCLCYGILTMVSMELLLQPIGDKCFLLDVLLPEFLSLTKSCTDVCSKLLAAKSVYNLTQRVRSHIEKGVGLSCDGAIRQRLHGESPDMTTLLEYVWTSWEDSVDAIRFTVKDVFENVVAIHTAVHPVGKDMEDPFLYSLTESILADVSWSCKGKYGTLAVLVSHIGSARMLEMHDGIAGEILEQLKEHTLSCYASELYESLFKFHKAQLEVANTHDVSWYKAWVNPVITALCGTHKLQKKHVIEYILPKVLKMGQDTLQYMITTLTALIDTPAPSGYHSHTLTQTENQLGALVMCLRRARVMGQFRSGKDSKGQRSMEKGKSSATAPGVLSHTAGEPSYREDLDKQTLGAWCGLVNVSLLQKALICKDEQIRLDGFALLCENQKTSETITSTELELIQKFIPQNLNSHNPAFRQVFLSHIKKFLSRMKESSIALTRQLNKDDQAAVHLQNYKDFLEQLTRHLFCSLYPGCVFTKRTTCLGALSLILNTYSMERKQTEFDFSMLSVVRPCDIITLLECLTDTYEDNKREAASILMACTQTQGSRDIMDEKMTSDMTDLAFRLSHSTRPQDCMTAAYLFKVLLHQPTVLPVLHTYSTHIQNKAGCSTVVENTNNTPTPLHDNTTTTDTQGSIDEDKTDNLQAGRHDTRVWEYFQTVRDDELGRTLTLLWIHLDKLQEQVAVAKSNLIVAAANAPMYPTMLCMRYSLAQLDFTKVPDNCRDVWQMFFERFISLCLEISSIVSPVVQNSSPEGNVPLDEIPGHGVIEDPSDESATRSHNTVMLMPEYLIVCCWRSTKEISLIFGQLTTDLPVANPGTAHTGLLSLTQVLEIGEYFTTQLLESVHRGAFELAYAGFVKLTDMLWRSSIPDLHQMPKRWLSEVLLDIKSGSAESRLCATRRSAGVPFYVQALVSTEPVSTGRTCFKESMQQLLYLAFDESLVTPDSCSAKVHALNILRALYKDSRLKDDVAPYVADGLKVAILGFKSALWAVRNSATLLMTAMMTRIFGVKRSKDESSFSRKNCQTGKTFFFKYPNLYQFLLDQLTEATQDLTNQLHPGLFPILMVLGRLFPSTMEGTDTSLNLAAFIPLVIRCSSSPVLKTRVMAARALQPLVEKDHVTEVFTDLLSTLPCQSGQMLKQNQIHGVLLQVKGMMTTVAELPVSVRTGLGKMICDTWSSRVDLLITRSNLCVLTRKEALLVTAQILNVFGRSCMAIQHSFETVIKLEVREEQQLSSLYQYSPGLSEFRSTICSLSLEFMTDVLCDKSEGQTITPADSKYMEDTLLTFLKSDSYEVRKCVLSRLLYEVQTGKTRALSTVYREPDSEQVTCADAGVSGVPEDRGGNCKGLQSVRVYNYLLAMVEEEAHEDCQVHLFRLLEGHPLTFTAITEAPYGGDGQLHGRTLFQAIGRLCQRIEYQSVSDSVVAAMIDYAGSLLLALCLWICNKEAENQLDTCDTLAVSQLLGVVQVYSGSDCSTDIHMACVSVLQKTCKHILLSEEHNVLGTCENRRAVFGGVLALLQADDVEVRDEAADMYCVLSHNNMNVRAHPYACVKLFLEDWIKTQPDRNLTLTCMLRLIEGQGPKQQVLEERLFDRGEMNAYRDEIDVIQIADLVLRNSFGVETSPGCHTEGAFTTGPASTNTAHPASPSLAIQDINMILGVGEYFDQHSITVNSTDLAIQTAFESGGEYETHVKSLYTHILYIQYGLLCSLDRDLAQKCDQALSTLDVLHKDCLPTLLKDKLDSLHR